MNNLNAIKIGIKIHLILADGIGGPVGGDPSGLDHLLRRIRAAEPTAAAKVH